MIGLDTNVLLAWILSNYTLPLPESDRYRIGNIVIAELVWVLARSMDYDRNGLIGVVDDLLSSPALVFEDPAVLRLAFEDFKHGRADFPDNMIARSNDAAGCVTTVTLDRKASREPTFSLLTG